MVLQHYSTRLRRVILHTQPLDAPYRAGRVPILVSQVTLYPSSAADNRFVMLDLDSDNAHSSGTRTHTNQQNLSSALFVSALIAGWGAACLKDPKVLISPNLNANAGTLHEWGLHAYA